MRRVKHGQSQTKLYASWRAMLQRCHNPKSTAYATYGGRGITVCPQWRESFLAFRADVGEKPTPLHTLDRFPNQGGNYEPGNVRWATRKQQSNNIRKNLKATVNGIAVGLAEVAERSGIKLDTLQSRHRRGHRDDSIARPLIDISRPLTIDGRTLYASEWARVKGINKATFFARLRRGWSVSLATSVPTLARRRGALRDYFSEEALKRMAVAA